MGKDTSKVVRTARDSFRMLAVQLGLKEDGYNAYVRETTDEKAPRDTKAK